MDLGTRESARLAGIQAEAHRTWKAHLCDANAQEQSPRAVLAAVYRLRDGACTAFGYLDWGWGGKWHTGRPLNPTERSAYLDIRNALWEHRIRWGWLNTLVQAMADYAHAAIINASPAQDIPPHAKYRAFLEEYAADLASMEAANRALFGMMSAIVAAWT